jgi:hypothetical protein
VRELDERERERERDSEAKVRFGSTIGVQRATTGVVDSGELCIGWALVLSLFPNKRQLVLVGVLAS